MILPFLLALLAFLVLLGIVSPLLRNTRPVAPRAAFDQVVYRDQLRELERDVARGLITGQEADAARAEIQRRLLAADRRPPVQARLSRSPVLAGIVFVFVAFGSVGLYLQLGAPAVPDEPFAQRSEVAGQEAAPMREAAAQLAKRLQQNPSDGQGWLLYARSLANMGDWNKAEAAYRQAMALGQKNPDIQAEHAETMVMQAGGMVTPPAADVFHQVLAAAPDNAMAHYYLAVADAQAGQPKRAIDGFQALLASLPQDSAMRAQIGQRIAQAARAAGIPPPPLAKGTPSADAVAQQPDAQQEAMIRGMVASLAAKQQADPNNLDGWLRLGRAYSVLHEDDKAAEAYEKAAALKPDDISIPLAEARALLSTHKPPERIPPRVVDLLKRVQARDPKEPMVLWYLGIAAVQDGHPEQARSDWQTLLSQLPEGSEERKMIQAALDTLPKE